MFGIVSDTGYCRRLRSLQGEAYDIQVRNVARLRLYEGRHGVPATQYGIALHLQYAPPSRYLTNINT